MKALVFEPHDDDLIIGMGGTALKMMENGWEFSSVLMTDGRHGSNTIEPEELVGIRRTEKEAEAEFLGIDVEYLDYEDGTLWELMQENSDEMISEIVKILESSNPDAVFMPARDEDHPDHQATNILVSRALEKADINPLKISYIVWSLPFMEAENLVEKLIRADVEEIYDRKIKALNKHESLLRKKDYDEMIDSFNTYLGLLYSSYDERKGRSEVLGVQNPEKLNLLENLGYEDVSELSHGRSTEDISL